MSTEKTEAVPFLSDEDAQETLVSMSTYEGEFGRRFFLRGWNGDSQKHWTDAVKWTRSHYEPELARLRGLLEEAEKAGTEIEKYSDCPYARGLARNLLSKLRK